MAAPVKDRQDRKPREESTDEEPVLSEQSDKALLRKLRTYTEEWQALSGDPSQSAVTRRVELARLMRGVQDVRDAREPLVEVTVPRSVTGEPYKIGPAEFHPGVHHVRVSVARYLCWMIDQNQRVELQRLQSNGRNIDLGHLGQRARMASIARDDGKDEWSGRGS